MLGHSLHLYNSFKDTTYFDSIQKNSLTIVLVRESVLSIDSL